MSKRVNKLWAQAVKGSNPTPPQLKSKAPQSDEKPVRVQLPQKANGRALKAVLESLASQLKTEHMEKPGRICLTGAHIKIEWESDEK